MSASSKVSAWRRSAAIWADKSSGGGKFKSFMRSAGGGFGGGGGSRLNQFREFRAGKFLVVGRHLVDQRLSLHHAGIGLRGGQLERAELARANHGQQREQHPGQRQRAQHQVQDGDCRVIF